VEGIIGGAIANGERGTRRAAGVTGGSNGTAVAGEWSYLNGEPDRGGGGFVATRAAGDGYGVYFWLHA